MKLPEDGMLLRIFIGEMDRRHGKPLYEQIVNEARKLHLAGATVFRGIMGFGAEAHLHTAKVLRLSEDLPVLIELVDTKENLDKLMPFLDENIRDGLVTLEKVKVIKYQNSKGQ